MKNLRLIKEGETEFFVPSDVKLENMGPGKAVKHGFYNPAMEESRDISIAVVQTMTNMNRKRLKILDGLAAVGARGLRIAKEVDGDISVILNDRNINSINIAKRSIEYNHLKNVTALSENFNALVCKEKFDYIDIDPFGSPVPYMSTAVRSVIPRGIIAVTATDTATLCGNYKRTCIRKYSAVPLRTWSMHEIGLRILIGYIVREGARFDISLEPLLSYSTRYYMRSYLKVEKGAKKADRSLEKVKKIVAYDFNFKEREVGPLWKGDLHDRIFLMKIRETIRKKNFGKRKEIEKLIGRCMDETGMPPLFYDVDAFSSHFRRSPPKIQRIMKAIEEGGYKVSRTHFRDTSFKTDAPIEEIIKIFRDLTI